MVGARIRFRVRARIRFRVRARIKHRPLHHLHQHPQLTINEPSYTTDVINSRLCSEVFSRFFSTFLFNDSRREMRLLISPFDLYIFVCARVCAVEIIIIDCLLFVTCATGVRWAGMLANG